MESLGDIPREEITHVVTDIDLMDMAIKDDICFIRDPNVVARMLCFGCKLVKIQNLKAYKSGNKPPQRIVNFGFANHDDVYKMVVNSKLNIRSSLEYQNINSGELDMYQNALKTILHSVI